MGGVVPVRASGSYGTAGSDAHDQPGRSAEASGAEEEGSAGAAHMGRDTDESSRAVCEEFIAPDAK
ncbi:hypothetical protein HEK616_08410 [Streptomyces nigrescens]|uniref:Uncharacterized protein n=1 Tax=Streptomyces nigrescens TaxID=1920 RepID=A0ABM7ZLR5_STRNI|nr:hypothetical protein HEK616_08410 [Streptomyces nigrescens]